MWFLCLPCPESIATTLSFADARLQTGSTIGKIYWLIELTGPEVGFRPSWSQGFKCHRDWASPSLSSAFLCGLASLSGRLVPSGGKGGPWQLQPVSYCLSHLDEGGISGDSQGAATGVESAGGGTAEPAGQCRVRRHVRANPERCGHLPRSWPLPICRGWSRSASWKKLRSKSRFWRRFPCSILRRSARQRPLKRVSN